MHNLKLCSNKNFTVIYQKKKLCIFVCVRACLWMDGRVHAVYFCGCMGAGACACLWGVCAYAYAAHKHMYIRNLLVVFWLVISLCSVCSHCFLEIVLFKCSIILLNELVFAVLLLCFSLHLILLALFRMSQNMILFWKINGHNVNKFSNLPLLYLSLN